MDVHGPMENRSDTRCPGGVSVSEIATNGQCGPTLLRKCHRKHTRLSIGGGKGRIKVLANIEHTKICIRSLLLIFL